MTSKDKVILLVEDNPDDELLTLRALRQNKLANDIVVTRDGEEALEYLFATGKYANRDARQNPQLILLDLKLPKVDGFEVLRRLRENEKTRLIPVVVLTSSDEDKDMIESYELAANSYVRKPVDFDQFSEAIRQIGMYWLVINCVPS
jgi:two-component system, response regulator